MTTRSILLADIDQWLARDDLSTGGSEETFLRLAESRINDEVRTRAQEVTSTLTVTSRITPLPDYFIHMRSVSISSVLDRNIEYLTPERIRESPIWLNQGGSGNAEETQTFAYTVEGANLVIAPDPGTDGLTLDIVYLTRFVPLVAANDSNSLLTDHYDIYLYAILHEASIFLQEMDLAGVYNAKYQAAVDRLHKSENRARFGGSALIRTGNPRRVV